jgi:hypothetical protein
MLKESIVEMSYISQNDAHAFTFNLNWIMKIGLESLLTIINILKTREL